MKVKYILGTLLLGAITMYTASHDDKYSIAMPTIFGTLTVFSIALAVSDRKEDNHDNTGSTKAQ